MLLKIKNKGDGGAMKTNNMKEKTRLRKHLKLGVTVMLLACLIAMASIGVALAGGGINHKVKVKNDSDNDVSVKLFYSVQYDEQEYRIAKGSSHTFETGAKCPIGLQGWVFGAGVSMVTRCTIGAEQGVGASVRDNCGWITCNSSDWVIRKQDSKYHFDKE